TNPSRPPNAGRLVAFQHRLGSGNIWLSNTTGDPPMHKHKILCTFAVLMAVFFSFSFDGASKNANSRNSNKAQSTRTARWLPQFKSPHLKDSESYNLDLFFYSGISVQSSDVVFVCGDMPDPKTSGERIGVVVRTTNGGKNWAETIIEPAGIRIKT